MATLKLGNALNLLTDDKSTAVAAINELLTLIETMPATTDTVQLFYVPSTKELFGIVRNLSITSDKLALSSVIFEKVNPDDELNIQDYFRHDFYHDQNGKRDWFDTTHFCQTQVLTLNPTSLATIIGTGQGTKALQANYLNVPGKTLVLEGEGAFTGVASDTFRFQVKLGSTVIADSTAVAIPTLVTAALARFQVVIKCEATGSLASLKVFGFFEYCPSIGNVTRIPIPQAAGINPFDFSAALTPDILIAYSSGTTNQYISTNYRQTVKM